MPRLSRLARAKAGRGSSLGSALRFAQWPRREKPGRGAAGSWKWPRCTSRCLRCCSLICWKAWSTWALRSARVCGQEATSSTPVAGSLEGVLERVLSRCSNGCKTSPLRHGRPCHLRPKDRHTWATQKTRGWRSAARCMRQRRCRRSKPNFPESGRAKRGWYCPAAIPSCMPGAIWGPVLAYCVLQGMAEAVGEKDTAATALALFDRLRLREPLARAFSFGEISEDGWRAAARVRLSLLFQTWMSAKPAKAAEEEAFAGFPRAFWEDGDARWLLKVHEAAGEWYFNKELHQQILWWTQLPDLLRLAAAPASTPANAGRPAAKNQPGQGDRTTSDRAKSRGGVRAGGRGGLPTGRKESRRAAET